MNGPIIPASNRMGWVLEQLDQVHGQGHLNACYSTKNQTIAQTAGLCTQVLYICS